jgi:carboxylate-amine ligase
VLPSWAQWNGDRNTAFTLGVEEEVMLLEPPTLALAQVGDDVRERLPPALRAQVAPETHAGVIELTTGVHDTVAGVVAELGGLRAWLSQELAVMDLTAASAGTHPLHAAEDTVVSRDPRYTGLERSMRSLTQRQPTMALHVHVGIPDPDDAMAVFNDLRAAVPLLVALSGNSPFANGRDTGFASWRTVLFGAFPRTGLPRAFHSYREYAAAVDALVRRGAIPDPSYLWWDVRLQPGLGTVEVRAMDSQWHVTDVAPLVALVQSIACRALDREPVPDVSPEMLEENRFLAARDGMEAGQLVTGASRLVPARRLLETVDCGAYASALGCGAELELVAALAASGGADRQRAVAGQRGVGAVPRYLAEGFLVSARMRRSHRFIPM